MAKKQILDDEDDVADWDELLGRSWDDVPEEKLLPNGTWLLKTRNVAFMAPKEEGQSGRVVFFYAPKEPVQVDEVGLADLVAENYDFSGNQVTAQFYIEGNRDWNTVRRHLAKHGVDLTGLSIKDSFKKVRGSSIIANLDVRSFENKMKETIYENSATDFAPVNG